MYLKEWKILGVSLHFIFKQIGDKDMTNKDFNMFADLGICIVKMAGIAGLCKVVTSFIEGLKYKEGE